MALRRPIFAFLTTRSHKEIASFEEQRKDDSAPSPQPVLAPGVYSNGYLKHPPRVTNILFLDLTNIEIADQMYLNYQLGKFFDTLKPDDPVAIYARPGDASILLQGFTSDRALLRAAVRKVMPRFPPLGRESMDDLGTLNQIASYLGQIPGRKNVLWFSGGSTLFMRPEGRVLADEWRTIFDELEVQRIAIYPIDVRGLKVLNYPINTRGLTVEDMRNGMPAQHALMNDVSEATGGRAVYDNNGLAQIAKRIIDDDGEYYTLTYSPHQFAYNNKWHQVRVTVPGTNYTLSYRRGYFADVSSATQPPGRTRTRLKASGATEIVSTNEEPIFFEARIRPGLRTMAVSGAAGKRAPQKGTFPYTIEYSLPLDAFALRRVDGKWKVECGVEIIALNSYGSVISHQAKQITFTLREEAALHPAGEDLPLEEEIDLRMGDVYVSVAVFDMGSKRLGAMEIPYHVDLPR